VNSFAQGLFRNHLCDAYIVMLAMTTHDNLFLLVCTGFSLQFKHDAGADVDVDVVVVVVAIVVAVVCHEVAISL
jgi:hypothetical protein